MPHMLMPSFTGTGCVRCSNVKHPGADAGDSVQCVGTAADTNREGRRVRCDVGRRSGATAPTGGRILQAAFPGPVLYRVGRVRSRQSRLETAVFSNVEVRQLSALPGTNAVLESTLETVAIASKDRRVVYHTTNRIEAPNWSRDGKYFVFNSKGHMSGCRAKAGRQSKSTLRLRTAAITTMGFRRTAASW